MQAHGTPHGPGLHVTVGYRIACGGAPPMARDGWPDDDPRRHGMPRCCRRRASPRSPCAARRLARGAAAALVACLPCVAASAAAPPLEATLGPRGEVAELRVGSTTFLTGLGLALVKPGWSGNLVDQRTADPKAIVVERRGDVTVRTLTLTGEGVEVRLRQTTTLGPGRLALEYELTPESDVRAEAVLLGGLVPADPHAGSTHFVAAAEDLLEGVCPASLVAERYVFLGSRRLDWLALSAPGRGALRLEPTNLTLCLQDDRKWRSPGFGLHAQAGGGLLRAGVTLRFALVLTPDTEEAVRRDADQAARGALAGVALADARHLAIGPPAPDRTRLSTFETVELALDVAATYDNPFDPEQIAVDATVSPPTGPALSVPGFYEVPMACEVRDGAERLRAAGPGGFRVRYTPTAAGTHRVTVTARDRSGTVSAPPVVLEVSAGADPGFVRTARGAPGYFAFDDGRPYVAVGENLCWSGGPGPLSDYEAWLRSLGGAGGNWARLWLSFGEKGQEWMPAPTPKRGRGSYLGLGRYALDNAWRLDRIVRLARENGVYLMFCLGTYGEFTEGGYFNEGSWVSNPYNARNGGPCATPAEFWTQPEARRLYQRRLRYLVARWGHAVNLFAWEFWNEVPPTADQAAWVAEMARYLKRTDPYRHLVSTTYGDADVWALPEIDFTMTHMYGQAGNTADFTARIAHETRGMLGHGKPYLLAEFGIDWQTDDGAWDRKATGLNMHNGAWAALLSGGAGTAMLWYWDGYVHPRDLYRVLTPVRRFADTIDWTRAPFAPLRDLRAARVDAAPETFSDLTVAADVEWGKTPKAEYTVSRDGTVEGGPVAATLGSPARGRPDELHSAVTWRVDLPAEGRMLLHLGSVCTRAVLQVSVDGEERLRRELRAGEEGKGPWKRSRYLEQYKVWVSAYDEAIPVSVPAGRHEVRVANLDGDWLQIGRVTLPGYRSDRYPDVNLLGIATDRLALVWLHHRQSTWRTDFEGETPRTLTDLEVTASGLADGRWQAQWWDTFRGEPVRTDAVVAVDGRLRLRPPPLTRDLALRAERQDGPGRLGLGSPR